MANNHMGHGFYQFSPELFFRIFREENGFRVKRIILIDHPFPGLELSDSTRCYVVADPAVVKERVCLVSSRPVCIMVHSIREETVPALEVPQIQSDYEALYGAGPGSVKAEGSRMPYDGARELLRTWLPRSWAAYLRGRKQLITYSFSNRRFYKPWMP